MMTILLCLTHTPDQRESILHCDLLCQEGHLHMAQVSVTYLEYGTELISVYIYYKICVKCKRIL
jgi:hypothetical protein